MGTTTRALVVALGLGVTLGVTRPAHAEVCTGITRSGGRFATCFDLGNRASLTAGSNGVGLGVDLRHVIRFVDEPDLIWKLEHTLVDAHHAGYEDRFTGVLYRGRFMRHARDGHLVIPLGTPKKIFLPFDIGASTDVGTLTWRPGDPTLTLGLVKVAALVDLARSRGFRRRLAFGAVARWDMTMEREPLKITDHIVAPFSMAIMNLRAESSNGLYVGDVRVEAGTAWRNSIGWKPEAQLEATVERIVLAVNDRPIAMMLGARYETATEEATARVGARIAIFNRRDSRVSLDRISKAAGPVAPRVGPPKAIAPKPAPIAPQPVRSEPVEPQPAEPQPAEPIDRIDADRDDRDIEPPATTPTPTPTPAPDGSAPTPVNPDEDPWSNTVPAPDGLSLPARPLLLLLHLR
ncbi:MAG TPA: hypothetical protein VIU61_02710 [Kofleriaceae bacterium]